MNDKLKSLKLDLLLKELKLLDSEKQYVDEFTNHYRPIFMDELDKNGYTPNIQINDAIINTIGSKQKKIIEVGDEELKTIKSVFRSIAKLCHPDKTKNIYKNKLYDEAQIAYDINDLLTLYKITKKLNIDVEINLSTIFLLEKIIEDRKKEIKSVETSFLWLWVNEKNEDKKKEIIDKFIKNYG